MLRNIDDISSIFWVSGHPDTIFANESRFLEKLEKIAQYRRYIGNLPIYPTQIEHKNACLRKIKKKTQKQPIYRRYIAYISAALVFYFFYLTARNC